MIQLIAAKSAALILGASILVSGCSDTTEPNSVQHDHSQHDMMQHSPSGTDTKVKHGNYEIELLVPEEGVFAGEEMDIEFKVTDTTKKDPVEGNLGIANVEATGLVTMPAMAGMPAQTPEIHREGIPGYYGIVLYFPHGGQYQIDLKLTLPGEEQFPVKFMVDVKDERPEGMSAEKKPYSLSVVDFPQHGEAGNPFELKLQVKDSKADSIQKDFQIVHEKKFHLLIASEDLGWFVHEHPVMQADGTWTIQMTFPAAGKYWIYGDVAPAGKSSQLLVTQVNVMHGPKPTWDGKLVPSMGPSLVSGVSATIKPLDEPVPVGQNTILEVQLLTADGKPVLDTKPWLGAAGHMMIIHQDGQTVVHSHPKEDAETVAVQKEGKFRFMGRFPKPGLYKAFAQFDHQGEIKTFSFVLDIK